jgi:hypothetical protein
VVEKIRDVIFSCRQIARAAPADRKALARCRLLNGKDLLRTSAAPRPRNDQSVVQFTPAECLNYPCPTPGSADRQPFLAGRPAQVGRLLRPTSTCGFSRLAIAAVAMRAHLGRFSALKIGRGQIVEHHVDLKRKQVAQPHKQRGLDLRASNWSSVRYHCCNCRAATRHRRPMTRSNAAGLPPRRARIDSARLDTDRPSRCPRPDGGRRQQPPGLL